MCDSLQPHGLQACQASLSFTISWSLLKLMSSSQWFHSTISSSLTHFSPWLQSFPASGSFPMSRLFISGSQSIGASALATVLPMNVQGGFHLGLTGLITLLSKRLSRVFFSTTDQISHSGMSDSLRPHESQHARPPCPSPTPGVHWDSCPSSQWCHPAISYPVIPFSSCPQSLPASESFPMS